MYIYKITNLINNKIYIGQTIKTIRQRWSQHCDKSKKTLISNAINKYGKENFKIEVIKECSNIDELNIEEEKYIKEYNSLAPNGYNLLKGGLNKTVHKDTVIKIRKNALNKGNNTYNGVYKVHTSFKSQININNAVSYICTSKSKKWCAYKYDQYCIERKIDTILNNMSYEEAYEDYLKYYDKENILINFHKFSQRYKFKMSLNKQKTEKYFNTKEEAILYRDKFIKENKIEKYYNIL